MNEIIKYNDAIKAIKTAILQGQYEAAKDVNRVQLAVYFSIGKYIRTFSKQCMGQSCSGNNQRAIA